jgi:hypothetical protein
MEAKKQEFIASFDRISSTLKETYMLFINKGQIIQKEWIAFMHQMDDKLDKALK